MKYTQRLSSLALALLLSVALSSCGQRATIPASLNTDATDTEQPPSVILRETEDYGQAYLDSFIFFGESTTYHLKSRGVLSGGNDTRQVWGTDNGTATLDTSIHTLKIRYPQTGEYLTVGEAVAKSKPDYLLLTFGLNGAPAHARRGKDAYQACYRLLLDSIRAASPTTKIILQSCFPVAENMGMSRYSVTLDELNEQIRTLNEWTLALAEEYGLRYLNTAEILTDENGRLPLEYQSGDGHHLTRSAYIQILHYIRTHGYQ